MAVDGYMWFRFYDGAAGGPYLKSESQVDTAKNQEILYTTFFDKVKKAGSDEDPTLFEVEDFSFGIEQTLNIGSQSSGAGAGKVTFEPFSITRKIDRSSPVLFKLACAGQPFEEVALGLRKSSGGGVSGRIYLVFRFKLVAVKTIQWAYSDESPTETVTFEYGGLQVHYSQQEANGNMLPAIPGGWNRVKNIKDVGNDLIR